MADLEFRIDSDSPANDDLKFWRIVGHEGLARPSSYELTVLSAREDISASDILGRAFDVVIEFFDADEGKHERHAKGHAVRFTRMAQIGRYFEYRISLRSWFWLLTKRINSRILQDKPVLEVLDAVFEDSPITSIKKTNIDGVIATHDPRRYCVQFQESDFSFLSRILEDEGIYYWFDAHDTPGTMCLSDASDMAHAALPVSGVMRFMPKGAGEARFNEIEQWVSARQFQSGTYASRDTDYKAINRVLKPTATVADDHELSSLEVFEYPGGYFKPKESDVAVPHRADEMMARRQLHWAVTHWPDVTAGRSFTLEGDPAGTRNGDYLIGGCIFAVTHPGYEGLGQEGASQPVEEVLREAIAADAVNVDCLAPLVEMIRSTPALRNATRGTGTFLITALPAKTSFRPPRLTPRVTMPGPQSAIVVGGKGKEHDVDEMGRVMVHFHWDRYDERDDKSTCRIRVSQPWAGKGWGGYFAPRIHQEVIVDFMNGDPDRPIIVGRVYNDDQPIPYKSATQSGFKTRSTPGGGNANYNEIMFEDKKGEELVNIHAERNMSRSVEVDDSITVGHDQSITVDNDRTVHTIGNEKREVDKDQRNIIHQHQHTNVTWCQYNHIGQHQQNIVGDKGQFNQIAGKVDMIIGQTLNTNVTGAMTQYSASLALTSGPVTMAVGTLGIGASGNISVASAADRKDTSGGSHMIAATSGIKIVSAGDVDLMSYANINQTSTGSNTTVLGSNSSGYLGMSNEANMGLATSTFLGLQMGNFMGASIDNALAISMENCAGLRMGNIGALDLSLSAFDIDSTGIKVVNPGAGGGAAAGAMVAVSALAGLGAAAMGVSGVAATLQQYADAAKALRDTAAELDDMPVLQSKLNEMATAADRRLAQGRAGAGAAIGAVVGGAAFGPGGVLIGAGIGAAAGDAALPATVATPPGPPAPHEAPRAAPTQPAPPTAPPAPGPSGGGSGSGSGGGSGGGGSGGGSGGG